MDGQTAFLQVLGQLKITDLMIYVLAAGYLIPQGKNAVYLAAGIPAEVRKQGTGD